MPLPKPRKNENENNFVERCMGDPKMVQEYPDSKQRVAVCHTQWKSDDSSGERLSKALR